MNDLVLDPSDAYETSTRKGAALIDAKQLGAALLDEVALPSQSVPVTEGFATHGQQDNYFKDQMHRLEKRLLNAAAELAANRANDAPEAKDYFPKREIKHVIDLLDRDYASFLRVPGLTEWPKEYMSWEEKVQRKHMHDVRSARETHSEALLNQLTASIDSVIERQLADSGVEPHKITSLSEEFRGTKPVRNWEI